MVVYICYIDYYQGRVQCQLQHHKERHGLDGERQWPHNRKAVSMWSHLG